MWYSVGWHPTYGTPRPLWFGLGGMVVEVLVVIIIVVEVEVVVEVQEEVVVIVLVLLVLRSSNM